MFSCCTSPEVGKDLLEGPRGEAGRISPRADGEESLGADFFAPPPPPPPSRPPTTGDRKVSVEPAQAREHEPQPGAPASTAIGSLRRRLVGLVLPGTAAVAAGLGEAFGMVFQEKDQISTSLISWVFDTRQDTEPTTPASALGNTTPKTPKTPNSSGTSDMFTAPTVSFWSTGTGKSAATLNSTSSGSNRVCGPTSVRVAQRRGQELELVDGVESEPEGFLLPEEPMNPGDAETLLTRRVERVRIDEGQLTHVDAGGTRVATFTFHCQMPAVAWVVPMHVAFIQDGFLGLLSKQASPDAQALPGFGSVLPNLARLLRERLLDTSEARLSVRPAGHGCVEVEGSVPFDFEAVAVHYRSVHKLLKTVKSCTMRFTQEDPSTSSAVRQVMEVLYDEGQARCRFLVQGRYLAWADKDWRPVLHDGKVAVVESPVENPGKEVELYLRIENGRLRLSDYGCIGLSSVPLADMTMRLGVSTARPLGEDSHKQGDASEAPMTAQVGFRLVDVSAFPAEMIIRPFFNARLMRTLLAQTLQVAWTLSPCGSTQSWQLQLNMRASLPPVARAFKSCIRTFVSYQVGEMTVVKLLADLFSSLGKDLEVYEAERLSSCEAPAEPERQELPAEQPSSASTAPPSAPEEAAADSALPREEAAPRAPLDDDRPTSAGADDADQRTGCTGCGLRLRRRPKS